MHGHGHGASSPGSSRGRMSLCRGAGLLGLSPGWLSQGCVLKSLLISGKFGILFFLKEDV